ncbi:2-alkenal reductase (NADP(+)-dependent)-like [Cynara cardunculus var. scolymus]|uniref:2-alkenal reductase (NADP(+)-dependent)-like n=1 Tax=Cynara cardunculus var. scolymus TaxID=59895 RepID=UPI000D62B361|nr:2-alkenal reductase (NADP(+)-dependent)-like [Cynara cardunculus var. scolymus]
MEVTNKYVAIKAQVDGAPEESDFEFKTELISLTVKPGSKDIIIKNLYVSIDPYQVNRMKTLSDSQKTSEFAVGIKPGEVIDAYGVGKVVASGNQEFEKGDYVVGLISWGEYSISKGVILSKLDPMGLPLSYHVGLLGLSGLTAYAGLFEICKPKKGEKVFVSAASGSVGNLVGQYAKLFGCYVVGCAGSPKKVKLLKEKLGFDEAFNYKEETDLNLALQRYFPEGIDIYFDNVGAGMLEAAILNMNLKGRVAVCGVISEYTDTGKRAAPDMLNIIYKRISIQGFLAGDYMSLFPEFASMTIDHVRTGKMHVLEDVSIGLETVPSAFVGLFHGYNVGKRIVQVSED